MSCSQRFKHCGCHATRCRGTSVHVVLDRITCTCNMLCHMRTCHVASVATGPRTHAMGAYCHSHHATSSRSFQAFQRTEPFSLLMCPGSWRHQCVVRRSRTAARRWASVARTATTCSSRSTAAQRSRVRCVLVHLDLACSHARVAWPVPTLVIASML